MTKLCVFDFDGTLVNTIYDIAACMNTALKKLGRAPYDTEAYYQMVGNGAEVLCRRALPDGTEEELQMLIRIYKETYRKEYCVFSKLYDGIQEMLDGLKERGIRLGIISNKPQEQMDLIVKELLGNTNFCKVIGQDGRFPVKPATDSLDYIMLEENVSKDEVWFIGDSDVDMQFGNAGGVRTIGAAWGFRGEEELFSAGATKIAYHPLEILDIV